MMFLNLPKNHNILLNITNSGALEKYISLVILMDNKTRIYRNKDISQCPTIRKLYKEVTCLMIFYLAIIKLCLRKLQIYKRIYILA